MTTSKAAPDTVSVKVHILNKEYQIQCPPTEKHKLIQAAVDVDTRMRAGREAATNITTEKAAVLTALNLAHELQGTSNNTEVLESISDSFFGIKARIEKTLSEKPVSLDSGTQTEAQSPAKTNTENPINTQTQLL